MNDVIPIVLITDKNYFDFMLVTVSSVLDKTKANLEINIVLTFDLNEHYEGKINKLKERYLEVKMNVISYKNLQLNSLETKNHVSNAAFVKVKLTDIFSTYKKIILLDCDLLVLEDIEDLWSISFGHDKTISAVWNPNYFQDNNIFGIPLNQKTFNSGVMVLDLDKMRKNKDSELLLDFLNTKNHLTILNDQAAFNYVYKNNWYEVPANWNVQYKFFLESSQELGINFDLRHIIITQPKVIHFTTHSKPWMFKNAHPYKKEFLDYLKIYTPEFRYSDLNVLSFLKRIKEHYNLKRSGMRGR